MGLEPKDLICLPIRPIKINDRVFREAKIDLEHINKGKARRNKRSHLEVGFILMMIFQLDEAEFKVRGEDEDFEYFSEFLQDQDGRFFKLIFCLPKDDIWIGVITLFRVKDMR